MALRPWLGVTLLAAITAGCHQPYKMSKSDYIDFNHVSGAYEHQVYDTDMAQTVAEVPHTVRDPAKKDRWELTLEEAKRIALTNNRYVAVQSFRPGESGALIDKELAVFDTWVGAGGTWTRLDQQTTAIFLATQQDLFQGGGTNNITSGAATDGASQTMATNSLGTDLFRLYKRNSTGGITQFSYGLAYELNPNQFRTITNSWQSAATFSVAQPLLQGAGVEFNRAPILIARATAEQSIRDFEKNVRDLLRAVERQYWILYFSYQSLYSAETGMKQALVTWQKEKNKQELGAAAEPDVAQARETFEGFRAQRLEALGGVAGSSGSVDPATLAGASMEGGGVLDNERRLRAILGLPLDDERQIVPADEPTVAEYQPNWSVAVLEAMDLRPELASQRLAIRSAELTLMRQRNGLLPDLTVGATYRITGLDNQFDQSVDRLTDNRYSDWVLGFSFQRQVGERAAHAGVRNAQLALSRERAQLLQLEQQVVEELHATYQALMVNYDLIKARKAVREASTKRLVAQEQFYRRGKTTIDELLRSQQNFAESLVNESRAIVLYNFALVDWEWAKGTILQNDHVMLAEHLLDNCNPKLARQRAMQLKHSVPLPLPAAPKHPRPAEEIIPPPTLMTSSVETVSVSPGSEPSSSSEELLEAVEEVNNPPSQ